MSEWFSTAGAALMIAATIPQVIKLLRTRSAHDFAWGFTILNFAGIMLLGLRSLQIGEWGFVFVNAFTSAFWALVVVMKIVTRNEPSPHAAAGTATLVTLPPRDGR